MAEYGQIAGFTDEYLAKPVIGNGVFCQFG